MFKRNGIKVKQKKYSNFLGQRRNGCYRSGEGATSLVTEKIKGAVEKSMVHYLKNFIKISQPAQYIVDEINKVNLQRVFYLSLISIPMRIIAIINFITKTSTGNENELKWRMGIITSHIVFLVITVILGGISHQLSKRSKPNYLFTAIPLAMVFVVLLVGTVITSVDQLVTPSITPFLISCAAVGAIFLLRPFHSILVFLFSYLIYHFALGYTQLDASVLLSNRINGLTATFLGVLLSLILWRSNVINLQQKERIARQQMQLEAKNKELQRLANYDSLTGLINRRYFEEKIAYEISRIKRYGQEACLVIFDIDNFKSINDKYGHPVGDEILKKFASLLKAQLRKTDIIARIGGEEFAALLLNADKKTGKLVAEKIRKSIEEEVFYIDDLGIKVTVSMGITVLSDDTDSYEEGYKFADKALYRAKAKGKNRIDIELKGN
ncbi:MAG: diguanylate cyclase [Firmicutes bacterium]|nr:diguanylate cyclase [Bacillota bacterium]